MIKKLPDERSRRDSRPFGKLRAGSRLSSRAKPGSLLSTLSKIASVSLAMLREIFDESAYERFLAQHHLTSSVAAYSRFCHERDHSRARRPRCC
jgi:hypothetical protein